MNKRQRKKRRALNLNTFVRYCKKNGLILNNFEVRRKRCHLHGWAPNQYGKCLRCVPVPGLTKSAAILAYLRGWKRPRSMTNKEAIRLWTSRN